MCSEYSHLICRTLFSHLWAVALCQSIHEMKIEILFSTMLCTLYTKQDWCSSEDDFSVAESYPIALPLPLDETIKPDLSIESIHLQLHIFFTLILPVFPLDARIKCSLLSDNSVHEESEKKYYMQKLSSGVHCRLSSTSPMPTQRVTQISSWSTFKWRRRKRKKGNGRKTLEVFPNDKQTLLGDETQFSSRVSRTAAATRWNDGPDEFSRRSSAATWLAFQVCRLETRSTGWGAWLLESRARECEKLREIYSALDIKLKSSTEHLNFHNSLQPPIDSALFSLFFALLYTSH